MIRFLQKFDTIELAPDGQPSACRPPAGWKTITDSRKAVEHFIPKSHLTMYAKVRISFAVNPFLRFVSPLRRFSRLGYERRRLRGEERMLRAVDWILTRM